MKIDELIEAVKNGTLDKKPLIPDDINSFEIMNITDMTVLRELAKHQEKFQFLSETETWEKNENRQYKLGSMDRLNFFLKEIANGACRCLRYKQDNVSPESQADLGLIHILEKIEGNYTFEVKYECQCTACGIIYDCFSQKARFGISYSWIKKTRAC